MSTVNFDSAEDLDAVLGQLAGYASLCWTEEGVFESVLAAEAVKVAADRIQQIQTDGAVIERIRSRIAAAESLGTARIFLDLADIKVLVPDVVIIAELVED